MAPHLSLGDLARFDAIVVGPRAFETDSSLVNENDALLDYARKGGLVIVQYQQYGFFFGNFAPYPLFVASRPPGSADRAVTTAQPAAGAPVPALLGGHDRVTDERAVVSVVDYRRTSAPRAEPHRPLRLGWLGAGTRTLLRAGLGARVSHGARNA